MQPYTPGTQVKIRKPCPDCIDGMVELAGHNKDFMPLPTPSEVVATLLQQYHRGYCPACGGTTWTETWVSVEDLSRWLVEI